MPLVVLIRILVRTVAFLALFAEGFLAFATGPSANEIALAAAETQSRKDESLKEFTAVRRYVLKNGRLNQNAEMLVRVTYRDGQGKTFQVLSQSGSDSVHRRVFQKLLEAEAEMSRANSDPSGITPENYTFRHVGTETLDGRRCHVLEMTPRKNSKFLLNGRVWIDDTDRAVVQVAGRTSEKLSFWVGKPTIVQKFKKVNGYWLASANHSTAESRLLGNTELQIDTLNYSIRRDERVAQLTRTGGTVIRD